MNLVNTLLVLYIEKHEKWLLHIVCLCFDLFVKQLCFEKNLPLTLQPIYIILVYRCHVIGPRDAGKTTFAQGLLDRSLQDIEGIKNEELPCHVINTVQVYGQLKKKKGSRYRY